MQTRSILLAEDNLFNQKVAATMLKKLGFNIVTAHNGAQAVAQAQQQQFAVIFMDCEMPELDGYQATQQIRALQQTSNIHTPIIAMTAHLGDEQRQLCLDSGMDDYIAKPFKAEQLTAMLQKFSIL